MTIKQTNNNTEFGINDISSTTCNIINLVSNTSEQKNNLSNIAAPVEVTKFNRKDAPYIMAERLSMLPGVAQVQVYGSQQYAVRVQVDPVKMAANNIGLDQVSSIISSSNVNLPTGALYGKDIYSSIQAPGQLQNAEEYNNLILTYRNGSRFFLKILGKLSIASLITK